MTFEILIGCHVTPGAHTAVRACFGLSTHHLLVIAVRFKAILEGQNPTTSSSLWRWLSLRFLGQYFVIPWSFAGTHTIVKSTRPKSLHRPSRHFARENGTASDS